MYVKCVFYREEKDYGIYSSDALLQKISRLESAFQFGYIQREWSKESKQ
jgi:hypothetical protein